MTFNDHNPSIDPSIHTPEISHVCWQNPSAVNVDAGFSWMISPTISALCFVVTWWNNVTQRCQKTNQGCGALWEKNWIATASLGKNLVWNTVCSFVIYQYQYIYIYHLNAIECLLVVQWWVPCYWPPPVGEGICSCSTSAMASFFHVFPFAHDGNYFISRMMISVFHGDYFRSSSWWSSWWW